MNNKKWQESKHGMTAVCNYGVFAFIRLVDPLVGVSTICLLFLLTIFIAQKL